MIDLMGKRYGRLKVIAPSNERRNKNACWVCRCDCGTEIVASGVHLRGGHTRSCGCLARETMLRTLKNGAKENNPNYSHGGNGTRLYSIWRGMKSRCYNPHAEGFKNYGGRGIEICSEWKADFSRFRDWALDKGYDAHLTIDRINNDGNYEPLNCRWVTRAEQNKNKRNTITEV